VECDAAAANALNVLRNILGEPTIVVASGGEWLNPATGEIEPKLHLHWRLKEPTRTAADHVLLREARELASKVVCSDASAVPLVHPLRWPGSWHRKGQPKLAKIVSSSDNEIDLLQALDDLRERTGATTPSAKSGLIYDAPKDLRARNPAHIAAALREIPNDDLDWAGWNSMGLAIWAASGGSAVGLAAFLEWSAKSLKNDPAETEARWDQCSEASCHSCG
jgi:hypothetical protein